MTSALVRKYARALADVAFEIDKADQMLVELRSFGDLLGSHAELYDALLNPSLPFARKRGIVEYIAPRLQLSQPVVNNIGRDKLENYKDLIRGSTRAFQSVRRNLDNSPDPHDEILRQNNLGNYNFWRCGIEMIPERMNLSSQRGARRRILL